MKLPAFIELLKPITWFPPMWAFTCGAISSGQAFSQNWQVILLGILLTGPLVCASSQAVNDWFDRHVDAINEPNRPIPSGRIPGRWGLYLGIIWSLLSLAVSSFLGTWGFYATLLALAFSWAYSMPPIRLKQNGWYGNLACSISYEGLAWITGAALLSISLTPSNPSLLFAGLYSIGAHGIMTLNDFKAIEGDKKMGIRSLPVQLGADSAAKVACLIMLVPQVIVCIYLYLIDQAWHSLGVFMLIMIQIILMKFFISKPIERAIFYSGFGVPLFVSGMMVAAFGIRQLGV
ncbi:chlorophyll synthase ChlG [Polynucleobacter rarus]|uniref:chlorophyll synthase ChlG n=1 Tax=Polynucleobacter rarus TaxID=556055 RepID=UPI000D3ECE14|nr:chlorophyll synthase ChlG [Polynucleobacter rarus]